MLNRTPSKILAIGNPIMVRRLAAKIDRDQFTVTGCNNADEAAGLLENDQFDMVIVDNLVHNAGFVCKTAAVAGEAPVTVLLQEKPVNWRELGSLAVDGFLTDSGTNAEFMARLRAYLRRKPGIYASI